MPTVLRFDGLRAVIYPNDYRPAHVHVLGAGGEAVFVLNCPGGPPVLREKYGFARPALNAVLSNLFRHLQSLCGSWEAIHGPH